MPYRWSPEAAPGLDDGLLPPRAVDLMMVKLMRNPDPWNEEKVRDKMRVVMNSASFLMMLSLQQSEGNRLTSVSDLALQGAGEGKSPTSQATRGPRSGKAQSSSREKEGTEIMAEQQRVQSECT
jgi:hypothetical protein